MSFESREKKRRYKRAVAGTKVRRAEDTARRWFLTLARKDTECACCHTRLARKGEIVYRHEPREVRCVRCATRDPESKGFRPSLRWERAKRKAPGQLSIGREAA